MRVAIPALSASLRILRAPDAETHCFRLHPGLPLGTVCRVKRVIDRVADVPAGPPLMSRREVPLLDVARPGLARQVMTVLRGASRHVRAPRQMSMLPT